jgi:hypothetical protein
MSVSSDRSSQGAAIPPPAPGASSVADRLAATSPAPPILSVNNIEVVYDHVILVLKGVSLTVPKGQIVALHDGIDQSIGLVLGERGGELIDGHGRFRY